MVNYFEVTKMTLHNTNSEPKDNLYDIATSNIHIIRQTPTIPGAVARYVEIPVGNSSLQVVTPNYNPGSSYDDQVRAEPQPRLEMGNMGRRKIMIEEQDQAEHIVRDEICARKCDRRGQGQAEQGDEPDRAEQRAELYHGQVDSQGRAEQKCEAP